MQKILAIVSQPTKWLLGTGALLLFYSWVCQAVGIYFFWESGSIGFLLLLLGCISLCLNLVNAKAQQRRPALIEQAITLVLILALAIYLIIFGSFLASDAFEAAAKFLKTDGRVQDEIGQVTGVIPVAEGQISTRSTDRGEVGEGTLIVIAKGSRKFRRYEIKSVKSIDSDHWQVITAKPL
jgi:hypothetical protein